MKKLRSLCFGLLAIACMGVAAAYAAPPGAADPPVVASASLDASTCQIAQVGKLTEMLDVAPAMSIFAASNVGAKPEVQGSYRMPASGSGDLVRDLDPLLMQPDRWRT